MTPLCDRITANFICDHQYQPIILKTNIDCQNQHNCHFVDPWISFIRDLKAQVFQGEVIFQSPKLPCSLALIAYNKFATPYKITLSLINQSIHYKLSKEMKMQEESLPQQTFEMLATHPELQAKMVKFLFEGLSVLGFTSALRALQKQSDLLAQEQRIRIISDHLKLFHYRQACDQIRLLDLPQSLKNKIVVDLQELQLDYWLCSGEEELVLSKIMGNQISEARQLKLCEMIALGTSDMLIQDIEDRHKLIMQKCRAETVSNNNIKKLLDSFLNMEESSIPKRKPSKPPQTVIAESHSLNRVIGKVTFIKFNQNCDKIALLSQSSKEYELSVWQITNNFVKRQLNRRTLSIGWITEVKWSQFQSSEREVIGLCSYRAVVMLDARDLGVLFTLDQNLTRFLCFQWHPISEIVYVAGIFENLMGFDCLGELVTVVNPFEKTRELVFSPNGKLYTIAATGKGTLSKYCLEQQKVEAQFKANSIFMDLKYSEGRLLTSNKDFIYLIDAESLQVIASMVAPTNEKLFKIEVFECESWIVIFNQRLKGVRQLDNRVEQTNWQSCEAVDVRAGKMVTYQTSIRVWGSKQDPQIQEQDQNMEEVYENGSTHRFARRFQSNRSLSHSSYSSDSESLSAQEIQELFQNGEFQAEAPPDQQQQQEYEFEEMIELQPDQLQQNSI